MDGIKMDFTLNHSGVHWPSLLIVDSSGVYVFMGELLWTAFEKDMPPSITSTQAPPLIRPSF